MKQLSGKKILYLILVLALLLSLLPASALAAATVPFSSVSVSTVDSVVSPSAEAGRTENPHSIASAVTAAVSFLMFIVLTPFFPFSQVSWMDNSNALPKQGITVTFCLLLAEQTAQTAEHVPQVVKLDLCLNAFHNAFDLVVGQVNAKQGFHCTDRVILELCQQILVALDLFGQFFNFCFDVHQFAPVFL